MPGRWTQLLALRLDQSNISTIFGSDELTRGSAGEAGESITSSALTQPSPDSKAISSLSPGARAIRLSVWRR